MAEENNKQPKGKLGFFFGGVLTIGFIVLIVLITYSVTARYYEEDTILLDVIEVPEFCQYNCFDARINKTFGIYDTETSNYFYYEYETECELNCSRQKVHRVINREVTELGEDTVCGTIFTTYPQMENQIRQARVSKPS